MKRTRWKDHWDHFSRQFAETDFMRQVGKTVNRQPINDAQLGDIVESIVTALHIGKSDRVIDLCCGNGLITSRVAAICSEVVGVDYSAHLLSIANKYHRPDNVSYVLSSVLNVTPAIPPQKGQYTKVYMYEALQHFDDKEFREVLKKMARLDEGFQIFLGSIPDKSRLFDFYNTEARRAEYEYRTSKGNEAIGTWWNRADVQRIAEQCGYTCVTLPQNRKLYTAHYRFDALLKYSK